MTTLSKAILIGAILSLIPFRALAGESLQLKMGADLTHHKSSSIYSLAWQDTFGPDFLYRGEVGFWTDDNPAHKASEFGFVLLGKRFGSIEGFNVSALAGMGFIGHTDQVLSSRFEFTEELVVGYRNWGVGYKHVSSANIGERNLGRDYIFFNFSVPLTE